MSEQQCVPTTQQVCSIVNDQQCDTVEQNQCRDVPEEVGSNIFRFFIYQFIFRSVRWWSSHRTVEQLTRTSAM